MSEGKHTRSKLKLATKRPHTIMIAEGPNVGLEIAGVRQFIPAYRAESRANAARLVECWNMHDELVSFARKVAEPYAEVTDKQLAHAAAGNPGGIGARITINIHPQVATHVMAARAALAKARATQDPDTAAHVAEREGS